MGVTVQIGTEVRGFEEVSESWINDQIGRRRRDGVAVCVIVTVQSSSYKIDYSPSMPIKSDSASA